MPSVKLFDLFDVNQFAEMLTSGMVNRQYHQRLNLAILNYSHQCQFAQEWNNVTKQCRGLIYNLETEEVVARPFPKFFNASELGPSKCGQAMGGSVQVTDKMDGSLGILYPDATTACGWSIATRGSFHGDIAVKASAMLQDNYMPSWINGPSPHWTHLFEIIYPENRIVLDYGDKQMLVLLGLVETNTGNIVGPDVSRWPGPRAKVFPASNWKEAKLLPSRPDTEGYVLRNEKTGFMVKMKEEEYIRIHRIIFGMNERVVYQHLRDGRSIGELYYGVPEEFHPWITSTIDRLGDQFCLIRQTAVNDYEGIEDALKRQGEWEIQKSFAAMAEKAQYPHLLYLLRNNRAEKLRDQIWKMIPYDGRIKMAAEVSEDVA